MGADLRYVKIGQPETGNVAIVSLSARRDFENPHKVQVFGRLANYGDQPIDGHVTLKLNDRAMGVVPVSLSAMANDQPGVSPVQFDFTLYTAGLLELRHDHGDTLEADDAAWLVLTPPKRLRVLLVTNGNAFLERVLESAGVAKLVTMYPSKYEDQSPQYLRRGKVGAEEIGFDVIVFDGYSPRQTPVVESLYFAAAPPVGGLKWVPWREGMAQSQVILQWLNDHPLMRYVALDDVVLVEPGRLILPDTAQTLATSQSGPIMADVTSGGVHHVVVSFDLLRSNWPLQISFPVWVSNTILWLGLGGQTEAGMNFVPGQVAVVPVAEADQVLRYDGPATLVANRVAAAASGSDPAATATSARSVLPVFKKVGVYQTDQPVPQPWDRLAVNLVDATESDLRPAEQLEVGTSPVRSDSESASIRREIWPWFVGAALAVLMLEWLVYTRRMHL